MVVCPVIKFKAVERHALVTNWDLSEVRPDLAVESVAIHAEVAGRITESDKPRWERERGLSLPAHVQPLVLRHLSEYSLEFIANGSVRAARPLASC
jgi:hypothetical protein